MKAILMLEDGKVFTGESSGAIEERIGEVIFDTAVVGYQEMMTDPANAGKILVLTYPLIGNYGVAPKFNESSKVWLAGLVIKEKSRIFSNFQAKESLDDFVKKQQVNLLYKVDTRSLAVHLRQKGAMLGILTTKDPGIKELLAKIEDFSKQKKETLLAKISVTKPKFLGDKKGKRLAVLDLGVTNSVIHQLEALGFSLALLPYKTSAAEILNLKAKGLVISGGPENDPEQDAVVGNIKALVGKIPVLGISTGCQVLAQALGARLTKLKTGHRGANYPLHLPKSFKGEITAQNHGFVVDSDSLEKVKGVEISAYNLNDHTVESFESKKMKLLGVQYYPANPGMNEINPVFYKFKKILGGTK